MIATNPTAHTTSHGQGSLLVQPGRAEAPLDQQEQKNHKKETILRSKSGRRLLVVDGEKPFVGKGPQWLFQDGT